MAKGILGNAPAEAQSQQQPAAAQPGQNMFQAAMQQGNPDVGADEGASGGATEPEAELFSIWDAKRGRKTQ